MKLGKYRTINFVVLIFLINVLIVGIGIFTYYISYERFVNEKLTEIVEVNSIETANGVAVELNQYFDNINVVSQAVNSTIQTYISNDDYSNLDDYFDELTYGTYNMQYIITNLDGIIQYTYPEQEILIGVDESNKDYFIETVNTDDIFWSSPYTSNLNGEDEITIGIKGTEHVLLINIDLQYIESVYSNIVGENDNKELLIVDKFGMIIFDSMTENDDIHLYLANFNEYKQYDVNELFEFDYENEPYLASKNIVEFSKWNIIVYQDDSLITGFINSLEIRIILINLALLLTVVILISYLGYWISRAIKGHFEKLQLISTGERSVEFTRNRIRILDNLSGELNKTRDNLDDYYNMIEGLAYKDSLTKIFSREGLKNEFKNRFKNSSVTFIKLNINRFSVLNESYGYHFGNVVLKKTANLIKDIKIDDCVLGRIENDKFLIMTHLDKYDVVKLVDEAFANGILVDGIEIKVQFTYTVIDYPSQGENFEMLVNNLMQTAHLKHLEHKKVIIYKDEYSEIFRRKLEIELSLDESLTKREFDVVFQPIVLKDNPLKVRGIEALARWNHKKLSNISPGEFVPILEKTGKVSRLDRLIIFEAIKRISNLSKSLTLDYVLSCNVSVDTLIDEGFPQFIKDTLNKFKFNPDFFEIEITESTIIKNPNKTLDVINELTSIGVRFSQDDFGDGYSSLNYLTTLNISTLKLSKNLIDNISKGFNNRLLVNTVIELAHELGFDVIVEGVEDQETVNILNDFNCDFIQGFIYHKPLYFVELEQLLKSKENE